MIYGMKKCEDINSIFMGHWTVLQLSDRSEKVANQPKLNHENVYFSVSLIFLRIDLTLKTYGENEDCILKSNSLFP